MHKILIEDIELEPDKALHYNFDDYMKEFDGNIKAS